MVLFGKKVQTEEFEAAALPHLAELYRSAVHMVRDRSDAQDLVQNVYLLAWKAFHRFETGTNCRAWLFKILFNEIRHYRRTSLTKKPGSESELRFQETLASEPSIPEELRDEDILQALDAIPQEYREVVLLADVHEFAYKEIAETLNIPVGTVMSRLSRGRKQLRVLLAEHAKTVGIEVPPKEAANHGID
jgi:RNA polymerase sigma-70 factor (ECF subfamily)